MKVLQCVLVLTLVAISLAQDSYKGGSSYKAEKEYRHKEQGYGQESYADDKKSGGYKGGRYYYGGKYGGKCGPDGLYYRDDYSFVLCSNGKGYVQPCAPGTRNTGYNDYAPGYYYGYSDFCDVNLVDYGYSAPKYGPGYSDKPSYGFAAYRYPAGGAYGPKVQPAHPGPYSAHGASSQYGEQGYGEKQSYGQARYEQSASYGSGYKNDGYQTRNAYEYKDTAH